MLRAAVPHDLRRELGLPDACFADSGQGERVQGAGWKQSMGSLGDMEHAFPQVRFPVSSFQRVPEEPCFLTGMTDGDRGMLKGTVNGMGDGKALDNRNGVDTTNHACSFHKGKNIESMFTEILQKAKLLREGNAAKWDRTWGLGSIMSQPPRNVYQKAFGDMHDLVMQHDSLPVALGLWELCRHKGTLMGIVVADLDRIDKHHHPVKGQQGHHGRSSQRREVAVDHVVGAYSLGEMMNGEWYEVDKGTNSSANNIEARVNAALKRALGHAMQLDDLLPALSEAFTDVGLKCCGELQYSFFPDFFGQCTGTTHRKKSGRYHHAKTGRDFRIYFLNGKDAAVAHRACLRSGEPTPRYHHVSGEGTGAVYVVASDRTFVVAKKMVERHAAKQTGVRPAGVLSFDKAVSTLREGWESYMKNPQEYADKLRADARLWTVETAREHLQDDHAFTKTGKHGTWGSRGPTEAQVHVIVEADVVFNAQAFYRIVPRQHYSHTDSKPYLQEQWRDYCAEDPWCTDVGFFECQHCSQYSKTGYCEHVAAVTMIEEILPGVPRCLMLKGVGTTGRNDRGATKCDRYNEPIPADSPDRLRWSAQKMNRKHRGTHQ